MKPLIIAISALISLHFPANAQTGRSCAPRDFVVQNLADRYGERQQSLGLGANNAMIEVFASDTTGSWTILVTRPDGVSCIVASGQAFETVSEALPPRGKPA